MRPMTKAADAAKTLLRSAAQRLMTPDPTADHVVTRALDRSLDWSPRDRAQPPGARPFEPSFSETSGRALAFQVRPTGRGFSFDDQREIATGAARGLIHEHFGAEPLRWFDGRTEPARATLVHASGASAQYAMGLDRSGLTEVQASYEWGPEVMDMLPAPVLDLALLVLSLLPGLRAFATTIRTARHSGSQQVSFEITQETSLEDFLPLMAALGMEDRHRGLVTLLALVMGARFSLPAGAAVLTVMNSARGPEMRLDVDLDALPDAPEQLLPLLRLPLVERPQNLAALDAWMTAMTPEGYAGPGSVTVLSVRVRADLPARLALYLRPLALEAEAGEPAIGPLPVPSPAPSTTAPVTSASWSGQRRRVN